jgi:hypothetical protein
MSHRTNNFVSQRGAVRKVYAEFSGIILCVTALVSCSDHRTVNPPLRESLSMLDVYHYPITDLVDEQVTISARLAWISSRSDVLPVDAQNDTLYAMWLSVKFDGGEAYIPAQRQGEFRENIPIAGSPIKTAFNTNLVEEIYFNREKLNQNRVYFLTGRITYRPSISSPPVDDPRFIEQSNNPVYWSQTFEFQLENVEATSRWKK